MFCDSKYAVNSSENSASSWSARIIFVFGSSRIELSAIAVAVDMRSGWPARHPSPKKVPGPRSAMTACLPCREDGQRDLSSLDEEDGLRAIPLREDRLVLAIRLDRSPRADSGQQRLGVERR